MARSQRHLEEIHPVAPEPEVIETVPVVRQFPSEPIPIVRIEPQENLQNGVWVIISAQYGGQLQLGDTVRIQGVGVSDINGVNIQINVLHRSPEEVKFFHSGTHDPLTRTIYGKGRVIVTSEVPDGAD